jgi:hypothetical protein
MDEHIEIFIPGKSTEDNTESCVVCGYSLQENWAVCPMCLHPRNIDLTNQFEYEYELNLLVRGSAYPERWFDMKHIPTKNLAEVTPGMISHLWDPHTQEAYIGVMPLVQPPSSGDEEDGVASIQMDQMIPVNPDSTFDEASNKGQCFIKVSEMETTKSRGQSVEPFMAQTDRKQLILGQPTPYPRCDIEEEEEIFCTCRSNHKEEWTFCPDCGEKIEIITKKQYALLTIWTRGLNFSESKLNITTREEATPKLLKNSFNQETQRAFFVEHSGERINDPNDSDFFFLMLKFIAPVDPEGKIIHDRALKNVKWRLTYNESTGLDDEFLKIINFMLEGLEFTSNLTEEYDEYDDDGIEVIVDPEPNMNGQEGMSL